MSHGGPEATVVVIQGRKNKATIQAEQQRFREIAADTGVNLRFVNPLKMSWLVPGDKLKGAVGTIWTGSSDVDLMNPSHRATKKYTRRARGLAERVLEEDMPTLGICLGHEFLNQTAGGRLFDAPGEVGVARELLSRSLRRDHPVFQGLPVPLKMVFAHDRQVAEPGQGFVSVGETEGDPHSVLVRGNIVTMQPHPELHHRDFEVYPDDPNYPDLVGRTVKYDPKIESSNTHPIVQHFLGFAQAGGFRRGAAQS